MKKYILTVVAVGVFSLAAVGGASADAAPRSSKANENANCVGRLSSQYTHNGQGSTLGEGGDPSTGGDAGDQGYNRGGEIQYWQSLDTCLYINS